VPKIIENVRGQLLAEAKKQVFEHGYADTTIRSIARACGLGVGTVYNYFSSKEMLVATFVYEDWKGYLSNMQLLPKDQPQILLRGIYDGLRGFAAQNERLFSDEDAVKLVAVGSSERHKMLREQIAGIVLPVCKTDFCAEFIAEALMCWSMQDVGFENVYPLLEKIIK